MEEVGSEYGSLENLEPLQESSQDRKSWSFVPVGKQVNIYNDLRQQVRGGKGLPSSGHFLPELLTPISLKV